MPYPQSSLQTSGAISLNDIATEFGDSQPNSLSEFYGSDVGVPSSGGISFNNFYNKQGPFPGGLWTWGGNFEGALGLGDRTSRSSPVQVGALTNWKQLDSFNSPTASVKTDGTLWTWGQNSEGALGLGDTTSRSSPVQVGALTNWRQVSTGYSNTASVKTDGTLWTWGGNSFGQLGLGNTTSRSSPVQVGALTNWRHVSVGAVGTSAALKTDGTLWTWGANFAGELGLGDTTSRSSPVQVGALTNWRHVSSMGDLFSFSASIISVKADGTLWTWGVNYDGQLGLGDTTSRSSPVQVGALTNWRQVSTGYSNTASVKADGTLWTWGQNFDGQLGLGDRTGRSSPVQVGTLTNWRQVSTGFSNLASVKADGTLWTWGVNYVGQLGLGDRTSRSSPVQVGALTNWKYVTTKWDSVCATK
jgi:alpha-tubulin suppressor-like RCC1 family protein